MYMHMYEVYMYVEYRYIIVHFTLSGYLLFVAKLLQYVSIRNGHKNYLHTMLLQ